MKLDLCFEGIEVISEIADDEARDVVKPTPHEVLIVDELPLLPKASSVQK